MSSSPRAGSVNSRPSSMVTPGISPTVIVCPSRRANTSRCISWTNSWFRGPTRYEPLPSPYGLGPSTGPSGSAGSFEIMSMTSIRNPSTPRSSHQFIIEYTASRTAGSSQLRSG